MPLRKNVRPSSASGKLETSTLHSILSELRGSTASADPLFQRAQTSLGGPRLQVVSPVSASSFSEAQEELPEWLMKELLKGQQRSHSIGTMENISGSESVQHHVDPSRSQWKGKIEQQMTLEHLQKLHGEFEELEIKGRKSLNVESFKHILKKCMGTCVNDEQIEVLFMKIDCSATGSIQWHDFCTYMHLEYAEQDGSSARLKAVTFSLPATIQEISHGEPVLRIHSLSDSTFITAQEDGIISFWSPKLNMKRRKMLFEKGQKKSKWLMDFTIMTPYNKLILGTGDRELQLYEIANFEPYLQISGLEAIPLNMDYCSTDHDECLILYGDDQPAMIATQSDPFSIFLKQAERISSLMVQFLQTRKYIQDCSISPRLRLEKITAHPMHYVYSEGCVNILLLRSVGELLRTWKKLPKVANLPCIGLDNATLSPNVTYIRWKVHGDWVTQLNYYDSIKAVISASSHESTALVIGCVVGATNVEQEMKEIKGYWKDSKTKKGQATLGAPTHRAEGDQIVFRIHKGVKTFALSKKNNLIVTGGMDRLIRMWNPYMPGRPTGILRSHMAPIFYVHISEEDKIFSMSTDNTIKIWDIEDQSCLFTACSKTNGIKGEISACHYMSSARTFCVATDTLAALRLRLRLPPDPHLVTSHKEPVLCCKFNKVFRHVVSCSERSVIKVWDFDNGKQLFEFGDAHGSSAITCLTFDTSGRRLITGGRDSCLRIWNYNNGQCLHILKRDDKCEEVCDCTYVEINRSKYIIGVGWNRRINIFYDSTDNFHHIQKPQAYWHDDISRGHKEDILCIAQCPPTLLATASYDGEIIVWNMISGHICNKFHTPNVTASVDASITQVIFLKTRALKFESGSASLVSNGPQGCLYFWRLSDGDPHMASFTPSREKSPISSIAVTADDSYLYAADENGFVYVHNIKDYALQDVEQEAPKYVNHWRAHLKLVLSLEVIDEDGVLLSCSADCTVRLWSLEGEYIGTFGQTEPWEIFTPSSWKHPMVPYEILIDPQSMPIHPVLEGQSSDLQISDQAKMTPEALPAKEAKSTLQPFQASLTDEDLKEEINKQAYRQGSGRRLKHELSKRLNRRVNHRGPNAYRTINYYEIDSFPGNCEKPDLSILGTDIFSVNYQGVAEQ